MTTLIPIKYEGDVVRIRSKVREIAGDMGFGELDRSRIVQSVSELARNVVHHADDGVVLVEPVQEDGRQGIHIIVQDFGPGMEDLEQIHRMSEAPAAVEGYGLRQVMELMDEFTIRTVEGKGTSVHVKKWLTTETTGG